MKTLLYISAPHFTAGAVYQDGECIEAAPIIKWVQSSTREAVFSYLNKKGWKYQETTLNPGDAICLEGE